jgi:hypothetical protein
VERHVYTWTVGSYKVSEWSDMSTHGLLAQINGSEWSDMSINILLAENNVSEWSDMSTRGLLVQLYMNQQSTCRHVAPLRHFI